MSVAIIPLVEPNIDEHYKLAELYRKDKDPRRVCLFSNVLHDDHNRIYTFPVVEKALKVIFKENLEGLTQFGTVGGLEEYSKKACEFLLGEHSKAILEERCFGVQTISSIGALRLGAQFLHDNLNFTTYCIAYPDIRGIYSNIFTDVGFEHEIALRMPDGDSSRYLIYDLEHIPDRSVVVLQMCCGLDPKMEDWDRIAYIVDKKKLFVFFDATFHGLISDPETDSYPLRYFERLGLEFFVAQDFSFNMGLVTERPGCLCVVQNSSILTNLSSVANAKMILFEYLRLSCLTPPVFGAFIVLKILSNEDLREEFLSNLKSVVHRNLCLRRTFFCNLRGLSGSSNHNKFEDQLGIYINIHLDESEIDELRDEYHIYIPKSGLISIAGLNSVNMTFVCGKIRNILEKRSQCKFDETYNEDKLVKKTKSKKLRKSFFKNINKGLN